MTTEVLPNAEQQSNRKIYVTIFSDVHDSVGRSFHADDAVAAVRALIEKPLRAAPQPSDTPKGSRPAFSFARYAGARDLASLQLVSCVVLDTDNVEKVNGVKTALPVERQTTLEQMQAHWAGTLGHLYTSYSHSAELPKFRTILHLSRDITAQEYPRVMAWVLRRMVNAGLEGLDINASRNATQVWFSGIRREGHLYEVRHLDGEPLNVDAIIAEMPEAPAAVGERQERPRNTRLGQYLELVLKPAVSFAALLEHHGERLERRGSYARLWAPFRDDGQRPGCVVYDDDHYYDFGTGEAVDAVEYIKRKLNLTFKPAVDHLADFAKVERFDWSQVFLPARIDPTPRIEALPAELPDTGRAAILAPVYEAISTQDAEDQRTFVDRLMERLRGVLDRKTVERGIRDAGKKQQHKPEPESAPEGPAEYEVHEGKLSSVRVVDGEKYYTPLINGNLEIIEAVRHDHGTEETRDYFRIRATKPDGTLVSESIEVPTNDFDRCEWVTPSTGGLLAVEPGRPTRDLLRHAILTRSKYGKATIYRDFGWHVIDGRPAFLHAATLEPIRVRPTSEDLCRFALGSSVDKDEEARIIAATLRLGAVGPYRITLPLLASAVHAPVVDALPHRAVMTILGPTGALKTALALEFQRLFGSGFRTAQDFVLNFESTPTAAEIIMHAANDCLVVMDDAWPKSGREGEKQREYFRRLIHTYANGARRQRGTASVQLRASLPIRCILWMTSETDLATADEGSSTSNRAFKIQINLGDIDRGKLTSLQNEPNRHVAMRAYTDWLGAHPGWRESLPQRHAELVQEFRDLSADGEIQARQPEVLASLYAALEHYLVFVSEATARSAWPLREYEAKALLRSARRELIEVAKDQATIGKLNSPAKKFLRAIEAGLSSGRARLRRLDESLTSTPLCADIGWASEAHVYLHPAESYRFVAGELREIGDRSLMPLRDYAAQLQVECAGAKALEPGHVGIKRTVGGRRERVIEIPTASIDDVNEPSGLWRAGVPENPTQHDTPGMEFDAV